MGPAAPLGYGEAARRRPLVKPVVGKAGTGEGVGNQNLKGGGGGGAKGGAEVGRGLRGMVMNPGPMVFNIF